VVWWLQELYGTISPNSVSNVTAQLTRTLDLLMGLPSQNKPFLDNIKVENRQKKLLIEM
jgi:hypothetical protein